MIDLHMLCSDLKNVQSEMRKKTNNIIHHIYEFLNSPSGKTVCMIRGWKEEFRYIYGDVESNISSNSKLNPQALLQTYQIPYKKERWQEDIQLLFFAIQTYFSLLIKCMIQRILCDSQRVVDHTSLILGDYTQEVGVINYSYADWYCWPVFELEHGFGKVMDEMQDFMGQYEIQLSVDDFVRNNNYDYIKQMYEAIIPRELRHALGEYYTPDWLAEVTLREVCLQCEKPIGALSVLDPTCGSGTFLFKAIAAKRTEGAGLQEIVDSVIGFDINPLAVLTAKTNYLLSVIDLIDKKNPVHIPVYNVDVLKLGEEVVREVEDFLGADNPQEVVWQNRDKDRIRAACLPKVDAIVGNPPWVNWEYMPEQYRVGSQHKWVEYSLFAAKGRELSFAKEDISVLITYIVMDLLLKEGGILGFVIRQGAFKSAQNGVGFRRFRIKDQCDVKVLRVDDLSKIRAFENATTATAIFYARKGEETTFPVPYYLWEKRQDRKTAAFHAYSEREEVLSQMKISRQCAMPAVANDPTSVWATADLKSLQSMEKILGANQYRARTGVFTGGANAVYWMKIHSRDGELVQVTNLVERAKRKVEKVTATLEGTYLFPMLKGSNVKKWNVSYDTYILCPHTKETKMWPIPQEQLKTESPNTYHYLMQFKEELDGRKGFAGWEKEIQKKECHAILRVGEYTFSKYKVIWKYIASEFVCAVIGTVDDVFLGAKTLLPNEKIMYVSTDDEEEAYYLCGVLSSTLVANCVKSYMNPTSISAHVLNKLHIPKFDKGNAYHLAIAQACKEGHGKRDISSYIEKIDRIIAQIVI